MAPPAAEGMVDMAGSMFVPAGKVSNGHVVGRFPIGYTPFYPTVDLGTGKHAVMQVRLGSVMEPAMGVVFTPSFFLCPAY